MAAVLDVPLTIVGAVIETLYEAPIPLLVLGFFTLILTGIAFVSAAHPLPSSLFYSSTSFYDHLP